MEHRRMGGVTVHTIGASCGKHPQRRAMRVNIKSVLHGARWMVLRTIERCEVRPFCFNFRPICDIKTDAAEYILRPFPAVHHRMQGARPDTAAWQGDVNRFSGEAALH